MVGRAAALAGLMLLAMLLVPGASAAGDLPFRRPAGWLPEAAALTGLRQVGRAFGEGHAAILVAEALPRDPGLEASLDAVLARLPGGTPPPAERGTGITARDQRLAFARWEGAEGLLEAVVLDDGTRRVALLLRGWELAPRHALLARDTFDTAVRSIQPDRDLPPLVPAEDAGGLEGAFTGLHFEHRPNGEGDTEVLVQTWVLLFDPAGLFSRVAPPAAGGVAAHCRAHPADCGTYGLLGGGWLRRPDRIRLREGSGRYGLVETRELPLVRHEAALAIGETRLNPAAVLPPDTRLDGLWSMLSVSSKESVRRELALGRDGRFRRSVEIHDFRGDGGTATTASSGRYRLGGHRLVLEAEDGASESLGLLQPAPDSDGVLLIDGEAYLKRITDREPTE
jgi:hypothetical protein